jgi:hypothetical protein
MTEFYAVTMQDHILLPDGLSLELLEDVVTSMTLAKIENSSYEMAVIRVYLFLISNMQTERISWTYFSVKAAEGSVFSICHHEVFT